MRLEPAPNWSGNFHPVFQETQYLQAPRVPTGKVGRRYQSVWATYSCHSRAYRPLPVANTNLEERHNVTAKSRGLFVGALRITERHVVSFEGVLNQETDRGVDEGTVLYVTRRQVSFVDETIHLFSA